MTQIWSDPQIAIIAESIRSRTGLTFPPSRMEAAAQVLARAMTRLGTRTSTEFLARLTADSKAFDELLADLTIGETYFFRQPAQFDLIRSTVLPSLPTDRGLRLWSAGCATGEEAYSLAITVLERGCDAHVIGTDLSQARLSVARRGRYSDWSMRGVDPDIIQQYFRQTQNEEYQLSPAVRDAVEFRYLNLVADRYPALSSGIWGMDVILCRNVLIYLDRDSVQRVARRLVDTLSDEGWLLLGASDPLISDFVAVEVVVTDAGLCYRRRPVRPVAGARMLEREGERQREAERAVEPEGRGAQWDRETREKRQGARDGRQELAEPGRDAESERRGDGEVGLSVDRDPAASEDPDPIRTDEEDGDGDEPSVGVDGDTARILAEELRRIRELANQGRLAEAGIACASALDRYRDSAELMYLHGLLLLSGGQPIPAAQAARRALYLDPELIVAHLLMGDALDRTGDRPGASRAFRRASSLLAAQPELSEVAATDGEPAGRLLRMVQTRLALMTNEPD